GDALLQRHLCRTNAHRRSRTQRRPLGTTVDRRAAGSFQTWWLAFRPGTWFPSCLVLAQHGSNFVNQLNNPGFSCKDALRQLGWREMFQPLGDTWISQVQVVPVLANDRHRYSPGRVTLLPLSPPTKHRVELLKLEELGLGVVLSTLWQGVLVVPRLRRRSRSVKKEHIRGDRGVRCKHA